MKVTKQYQTRGKCLYMPSSVLLYLCGVASGYQRGLEAKNIKKSTTWPSKHLHSTTSYQHRETYMETSRNIPWWIPTIQTCYKVSKFTETKEPKADFTDDEVSPSVESWRVGLSGLVIYVYVYIVWINTIFGRCLSSKLTILGKVGLGRCLKLFRAIIHPTQILASSSGVRKPSEFRIGSWLIWISVPIMSA